MKFVILDENYLAHHGTKGQKWGVRRFQNEDGTLTAAGKERYRNMMPTSARKSMAEAASKKQTIYRAADNITEFYAKRFMKAWGLGEPQKTDGYGISEAVEKQAYEEYWKQYNKYGFSAMGSLQDLYDDIEFTQDIIGRDVDYGHSAKDIAMLYAGGAARALNKFWDEAQVKEKQKKDSANNQGKGSIPESAKTAKAKADSESRMKAHIPASAWNQRMAELNKK